MQRLWYILPLVVMLWSCAANPLSAPSFKSDSTKKELGRQHGQSMGGADAFKVDFKTLDHNDDGHVTQAEFTAHFPRVSKEGFSSLDLNLDRVLDEWEWGHFKKVHGVTRYPDNAV